MKMIMGVPSDAALLKDIQRLLGKETAEAIPGLELGGEETPDTRASPTCLMPKGEPPGQ